jgi:hypothetical protein
LAIELVKFNNIDVFGVSAIFKAADVLKQNRESKKEMLVASQLPPGNSDWVDQLLYKRNWIYSQ